MQHAHTPGANGALHLMHCWITCTCQLVEHLPSMQNVESHLRQLFFFSWEKEELSLGIVTLLCLVSMTEHTCTHVQNSLTCDSAMKCKYSLTFDPAMVWIQSGGRWPGLSCTAR